MSGEAWRRVAREADVPKGGMLAVELGGADIAIFHLEDGSWHATDNSCTHAYALLTEGWLEGAVIECPLHAGRFDVRTGEALGAPVSVPLRVYPVRIENHDIEVGPAA